MGGWFDYHSFFCMSIYACCTGLSYEQIEKEFESKGYGDFKQKVGEAVVEELRPIRERYDAVIKDKAALEALYRDGAAKAEYVARKTLSKAMKKVGFVLWVFRLLATNALKILLQP